MEKLTKDNENDIINFTNVSEKDFVCGWGSKDVVLSPDDPDYRLTPIKKVRRDYVVMAGETKPFTRFMAYAFSKHLIDRILLDAGKDYGSEGLRKEIEDKIFGNVAVTASPILEPKLPISVAPEPIKEEPQTEAPKEEPKKVEGFKCDVCGKVSKSKIGMISHRRIHK